MGQTNTVRKRDVIGFGALNVDLIYDVPREAFSLLARFDPSSPFQSWESSSGSAKKGLEPGGEIFGDPEALAPILSLLNRIGRHRSRSGGGSAANTILALSRMGFDVGYVGKVGCDEHGTFLIESLEGVNTDGIVQGDRSGLCLILLDEEGERSNLVFPNANDTLTYDEVELSYIQDTKFLHFTSFVGERPFEAQIKVAQNLPPEIRLSFDPGELYARRGLEQLLPILKNTYILFATDREIQLIMDSPYRGGAKQLLDTGPHIAVCKLGAKGSYVVSSDCEWEIPAQETQVVDKTGAGDVYAAGFLAGLLLERPIAECAHLATEAAALSIGGYGRAQYPDRAFLHRCIGLFPVKRET